MIFSEADLAKLREMKTSCVTVALGEMTKLKIARHRNDASIA